MKLVSHDYDGLASSTSKLGTTHVAFLFSTGRRRAEKDRFLHTHTNEYSIGHFGIFLFSLHHRWAFGNPERFRIRHWLL